LDIKKIERERERERERESRRHVLRKRWYFSYEIKPQVGRSEVKVVML